MKLVHRHFSVSRKIPHRGNSAFSLLECVVYMAMFALITGLSFACYYRLDESSRGLRGNADAIVAVLQAGEQWRADVRAAVAAPVISGSDTAQTLRLRQVDGQVEYTWKEGTVWRRKGDTPPIARLSGVQRVQVRSDLRQHVEVWEWTLELETRKRGGKIRPLFTFMAVPQSLSSK